MIHQANQEVMNIIEKTPQQGNGGKRNPYKKISDTLWAKVGKYALEKGNAAASRKFSKEFDNPLSESTVRSLKNSYTAALESKKLSITEITDDTALSSLPPKSEGVHYCFLVARMHKFKHALEMRGIVAAQLLHLL